MKKASLAFIGFALAAASAAAVEPNIALNTPPIVIVKHAMEQRTSRLDRFYDHGIIGLAKNGDIAVRDSSHLSLPQRQIAEKLVDAENEDRKSLIYAIADGNGNHQADGVAAVRTAMTRYWREHWKSGWYLQDDTGNWAKKP